MTIIINPADFIRKNWAFVKNNLKPFWDKLTNNDIQSITDYETLVEKLRSTYDLSSVELDQKLKLFVVSLKSNLPTENLTKMKMTLHRYTFDTHQEWEDSLKK